MLAVRIQTEAVGAETVHQQCSERLALSELSDKDILLFHGCCVGDALYYEALRSRYVLIQLFQVNSHCDFFFLQWQALLYEMLGEVRRHITRAEPPVRSDSF